jgi:hypothetical protein
MNKKEITLQDLEMKVFRNEVKNRKPMKMKITLDDFFNIKIIKKKDIMNN